MTAAEAKAAPAPCGSVPARRVLEWLFNARTIPASRAMVAHLAGIRLVNVHDRTRHPEDPVDFAFCAAVLDDFPEWRGRLGTLAELSPAWAIAAERWNEIADSLAREAAAGANGGQPADSRAPRARCPETFFLMKEAGL